MVKQGVGNLTADKLSDLDPIHLAYYSNLKGINEQGDSRPREGEPVSTQIAREYRMQSH